jgi:hypothetical protein
MARSSVRADGCTLKTLQHDFSNHWPMRAKAFVSSAVQTVNTVGVKPTACSSTHRQRRHSVAAAAAAQH